MAPCFHDGVTGEVQTACAREPTPGGRDLARPVAARARRHAGRRSWWSSR